MNPESANLWLQFLAHLVTVAGIPVAVALFYNEKRKERKAREEKAFDVLGDKYEEFMQLCLEHPDLDVFDSPMGEDYDPTPSQQRAEDAIFAILISLFERVFVMFEGQHTEFRKRQWEGWVLFMKSYSHRENFRRVWNNVGAQFDSSFVRFMATLTEEKQEETGN